MQFRIWREATEAPPTIPSPTSAETGAFATSEANETLLTASDRSALDITPTETAPPQECNDWKHVARTETTSRNADTTGSYVHDAPTLQDSIADGGGEDTIAYWKSPTPTRSYMVAGIEPPNAEQVEITEDEALRQLDSFLLRAQVELNSPAHPDLRNLADKAADLRENLCYINTQKFDEATAGVAGLWRQTLEDNPRGQLWVPTGIVRTQDIDSTVRKSSERVFDGVLSHLTPDEQARVVTDVADIQNPKRTSTVLLDDWSLTGNQLEHGLVGIQEQTSRRHLSPLAENVSLHLLAASDRQLERSRVGGQSLPTYAYYHAGPDAGGPHLDRGPRITGSHSSTDFGFEHPLRAITAALNKLHPDENICMPPPANLVRRG